MRNILLLNDSSPLAAHALAYGKMLATHLHANLLIWNIEEPRKTVTAKVLVEAQAKNAQTDRSETVVTAKGALINPTTAAQATVPVKTLQLMDTVNKTIHEVVVEQKIDVIIKGVDSIFAAVDETITRVLSNTYCPVLLVPKGAILRPSKRMVYMTDLRYCRHQVSNFLKSLARKVKSSYSIAHISAGLPEPEANYAISMYKEVIGRNVTGVDITFNHIKEKNVKKAADVLINMMHNDLIAMAYRRYHFKSLTDQAIELPELEQTAVPLLLFPS